MSSAFTHDLVAGVSLGNQNKANFGLSYGVRPNAGIFEAAFAPDLAAPLSGWWLNVAARESFMPVLSATAKGTLSPSTVTPIMDGSTLVGELYLDALDNTIGFWRVWKAGTTLYYPTAQDCLNALGYVQRADFSDSDLIDAALAAEPVLTEPEQLALQSSIDAQLSSLQASLGGAAAMRSILGVGEGLAKTLL